MKRTSPEVRVGSKTVLTPLKWDVCITPSKADIGQLRCRYVFVCDGAAKASAYNDAMCAEDALKGSRVGPTTRKLDRRINDRSALPPKSAPGAGMIRPARRAEL